MKSLLHPMRSTALCSLRSRYSMNMLCRFFSLSITIVVCSLTTVSAQNLPNTTRLLRFPTTNDRDIVFCYAGQLYTVGKDGGTARRLTSGPGYTSFARFSPDGTQIAFTSEYDGNREVYVMPAEGGTPKRLTTSATLGRDRL
jgi:tricorn protease